MWIFCCGMQRSGSTLQYNITCHLVESSGKGRRVPWAPARRFRKVRKEFRYERGWKVFKCHAFSEAMGREFERRRAVGIYCYRDIRDAFVSSMRKHEMTFEQMMQDRFVETILRQYQKWTAMPRVLVSRYEEMIADLPFEVARIAAHLGLALEPEACRHIAQEYTMEKQKQRIEAAKAEGRLFHSYANAYVDPVTNLHANHIHSGAIGGWKDVLTDTQVEAIEALAGDWLQEHGYPLISR